MASSASSAAKPRRGRPPQISSEDILTTVTNHLGDEWTVASIAAELGVTDSAIYRYFPTRKALLSGVAERIIDEQPTYTYEGDWRLLLTQLGRSWYSVYVRYPAFLDLDAFGGASMSGIAMVEQALNEIVRAGFELQDANSVVAAVTAVCREIARVAVLSQRTDLPSVVWDADTYPTLSRAMAAAPPTPEALFESTLKIVVEGAGQYLPKRRR